MYLIIDKIGDDLIAFNDSYDVCETYIDNVNKSNSNLFDRDLRIYKMRKKALYKLEKLYDLYLVRYGDTYIQQGYIDYLSIVSDQIIEDDQFTIDILERTVTRPEISKKDAKILMKAIEIMENIHYNDSVYTPDLKDLKKYKDEIDLNMDICRHTF